jgi:hypothetical protein
LQHRPANFFFSGSLATDQSEEPVLQPEELFFTSSGRVGVIVDVKNNKVSLHLTELQRNMAAVLPSVGGTSHTRYALLSSSRQLSEIKPIPLDSEHQRVREVAVTLT